ncbi:MAG: hypothetical protein KIS95_05310 [Anaerolineae bacterium]|nr:hypothetical protein [Anaerolineae bacterium]
MSAKYLMIVLLLGLMLPACIDLPNLGETPTVEEDETQGVIVNGIPTLTVNHFAGTITARDGEPGHITANLTKQSRAKSETDAQAQVDQIVMTFTQHGTDVVLNIDGPNAIDKLANGPSAVLELLVPPGTALYLNLGAGEITVEQPTGNLEVNAGAGLARVFMAADASFHLVANGGAAHMSSDFEDAHSGLATSIDTNVGDSPIQTLTFHMGAGEIELRKAQ